MTPTIRLGRLFGISVALDWSVLLILALIAWSLATSVLPAEVPHQPQLAYWSAGVLGAILFDACLLAHEMAHALVARSRGVKVEGITLWLFGGVSRLESEPAGAGAEALITIVGPLTSLAVSLLLFLLAGLAAALGAAALVPALLSWMAFLNVALAVFNLVPAFPLDGGRLLGSIFWAVTGSRRRGVHYAVVVGRVFAALMILGGMLFLFTGDLLDGIWLAFIGWFLLTAAQAEEAAAVAHDALRGVPVSAVMTSPVATEPGWLRVDQFLESGALTGRFTTFPLTDPGGHITGVVRLGDLLRPGRRGSDHRLQDFARPLAQVPQARPDEPLDQVLDRVGSAINGRILVFESGRLVGIVSPADVARFLMVRSPQHLRR